MKTTKHLLAHKNFYLCLAILWTFFIACLCLVSFSSLPKVKIHGVDKGIHFIFHFGFTVLWFLYYKFKNLNGNVSFLKIFAASFFYGSAIEIAQGLFTTTRSADIADVLANGIGSVVAILLLLTIRRFSKTEA